MGRFDYVALRCRKGVAVLAAAVAAAVDFGVPRCAGAAIDPPNHAAAHLRPPAVPLVANNPYFSAWSRADRLTDGWPTHWTGAVNGMCGLLAVDGAVFRWCGSLPGDAPAAEQVGLEVTATRTICRFEAGGVRLAVTFCSPTFADDPDLASRAVTLVRFELQSIDGKPHTVAVHLDASAEWAVHDPGQRVVATRARLGDGGAQPLGLLRIGAAEQRPLARSGDYTRIDWGWMTLAAPGDGSATMSFGPHVEIRQAFTDAVQPSDLPAGNQPPRNDDLRFPRAANDDWPVLAVRFGPESPRGDRAGLRGTLLLAYDEGPCVEWMGRPLAPWWARAGMTFGEMLADTWARRDQIFERSAAFDATLADRLRGACGDALGAVNILAYRQVMAAHCIATDFDGTMLMFSKENSSNGCIGTVDVLFPAAPFFLALNPDLLQAQLQPIMAYAASPRWRLPFAPHDLGTYPKANGQVYGDGEKGERNQMPVEECGNLLILLCALEQARGSSPASGNGGVALFADRWPELLRRWAEYLREHGLDPANQLCTDDFAGHLARNANLSVKAIVALGAYADLVARCSGDVDEAARWRAIAKEFATRWQAMAVDGDHTVLAFGQPGTWSLKYNLVWDRMLGLGLFPPEVAQREVAFYRRKANRLGVPMDSRAAYTKPEWLVWSAMLTDDRESFLELVAPIALFANETPDRVPLTDWYMTDSAKTRGMHSRSVVGGMYMPLLKPKLKPKQK